MLESEQNPTELQETPLGRNDPNHLRPFRTEWLGVGEPHQQGLPPPDRQPQRAGAGAKVGRHRATLNMPGQGRTRILELTVGEATLNFKPREVAQIVAQLVGAK